MDPFIRDIKHTGALGPCSQAVASALTQRAKLSDCKTVVELGPGTGAITKTIVENISPDTFFLALEINKDFATMTKQLYPSAHVYCDSAENMLHYLHLHGKKSCDCIISTLPWTLFDIPLQKKILQEIIKALRPGGQFLTVAYTFSSFLPRGIQFKKMLKNTFDSFERAQTIWKNFPPLYVYSCLA